MGERLVLVVDDDAAILAAITDVLEQEGYRVQMATSADAALAWLETADTLPGLILVDEWMPGTTGSQFCKLIETMPRFSSTKCVRMSAARFEGDADESLFLKKPIDLDRLLRVVHVAFGDAK